MNIWYWKFQGYDAGLDAIDEDYYDHDDHSDDNEFDVRRFHGDSTGFDDVDDYYDDYDDEVFKVWDLMVSIKVMKEAVLSFPLYW